MRRFGLVLCVLLVATTGFAAGQREPAAAEQIEFTISSVFESGHVAVLAADKWAELLLEESGGRIKANVVSGGTYGSEEEESELVTLGAIEAVSHGAYAVNLHANEYNFNFHFGPQGIRHIMRYYHPEEPIVGQHLAHALRTKANQEILAPYLRGLRYFTSNRPVQTPEDVRGIKLRLPGLARWVKIWDTIGALPTTVPLPELYTALATGAVDASEGDAEQLWSYSLYEVQSHLALTGHHTAHGTFMVNTDWFYSLPPEDQAIIRRTAVDAAAWATELAASRESELLRNLEARGMVVTEADFGVFKQAAYPALVEIFSETAVSMEDFNAIMEWALPGTLGWDRIEQAYFRGRGQ